MESFFQRYRNPLLLVALVLVQVIMLASQIRRTVPSPSTDHPDGGSVRLIRLWTESAASPFERLLHSVGHGVLSAWSNYFALRGARLQSQQLQAEVNRLRIEQASLAEDARQAHRLQALLQFQQSYPGKLVPAQVVGTSGSDQSRVLYVDKGSNDGIKPDMAVVTPDGIVGKIRDVFPNTAQVLLINDPTSGAGVLLETTRVRGVIRGNAYGQVEMINVMPDDRIQPGEHILASGGDQVYPRGFPVGTVQNIQHDPAHDPYVQVIIAPAANLSRLDEVLIVKDFAATPPQALAEDVATSESFASQQRKAAEVMAEKLPTVKPEEVQANELATGPDRPHQPPQPLHPDRFSVGATPPAADLKPGVAPQKSALPPLRSDAVTAPAESGSPAKPNGTQSEKQPEKQSENPSQEQP